ncbi:MAG: ferritin-like domain-containing protein [Salinisphaeraceae bacterium]|nr:ferritin-like domain-containing protein [Salinisphaeraceae bacterium]
MQIDLEKMLEKIRGTQWALADFDWDAPGRELVTENEELWPKLKEFMADLTWIEHVGARGFAALAKNAPNDTLKQIYTYFHAEEQRHANAELALMRRWGMLEDGEIPEPNTNLRLAIEWLDTHADHVPLEALASIIPTLEVALDGALCKFLLETVDDPLCHEVFEKINADEARHLGVGFHVLEMQGHGPLYQNVLKTLGATLHPRLLLGVLIYLPLLNRMRDNLVELGLSEEKLYKALAKFRRIGGTPDGRRNPWFHILATHSDWVSQRETWWYHKPVDLMVKLSDYYPKQLFKPVPGWVKQLTWRPTV